MTRPSWCSTPGHADEPARLYPCGWRCERCKPGAADRATAPAQTERSAA